MSIRLRRRPSLWSISLLVAATVIASFLLISVNKPLPSYLVAKRDISPGELVKQSDFELVELDLGPLSSKYLSLIDSSSAVISQIPAGELVPLSRIGLKLLPNQTSIRFTPSSKPAANVAPGSFVSIWQVVKVEDAFQPELLVVRAEVSAVIQKERLLANDVPEIELVIGSEQATLLITALAAKHDVFVLPLS